MSRRRTAFAAALALAAAASAIQAAAQPQSTASASAGAEIVAQELTLTESYMLVFGLVKSQGSAGTVVVSPPGTRAPFAGATIVGSGPCQTEFCEDETSPSNPDSASYWGPGIYTVTGAPGTTYRVTLGATTAMAFWRTPANGREPELQVTDFTIATKSSGYSSDIGTLDSSGQDIVRVGGTLQVIAGMKTASYRVHVPVTVQYN